MSSIKTLKREVEILHRALGTNDDRKEKSDTMEKLLFMNEKLIEFSRIYEANDQEAFQKWNLEIAEFNASHPTSTDDLIKIKPYLNVANLAVDMETTALFNSKR